MLIELQAIGLKRAVNPLHIIDVVEREPREKSGDTEADKPWVEIMIQRGMAVQAVPVKGYTLLQVVEHINQTERAETPGIYPR
jgi:hypothetical protein